jgi:hypothetical protein
MFDQWTDLGCGQHRVDRHDDGTSSQRAVVGDDQFGSVAKEQANSVPFHDPARPKACSAGIRLPVDVRP